MKTILYTIAVVAALMNGALACFVPGFKPSLALLALAIASLVISLLWLMGYGVWRLTRQIYSRPEYHPRRLNPWLVVLMAVVSALFSWWMFGVTVGEARFRTEHRLPPGEVSALKVTLRNHVEAICVGRAGRHVLLNDAGTNSPSYISLLAAADMIESNFANLPRMIVTNAPISAATSSNAVAAHRYVPGTRFGDTWNIIAELPAAVTNADPPEIIIFGAHYDTMAFNINWIGDKTNVAFNPRLTGTPGANDNGSGVAALIEMAQFAAIHGTNWTKTVRFVAFANEEPPFFQNKNAMGSWLYAQQCVRKQERIAAVISLETMANYSTETFNGKRAGSKNLLANLIGLPAESNYVAFMSGWLVKSDDASRRWAAAFSRHTDVAAHTVSLPFIPRLGTEVFAWSDDWSFVQNEIPAFAVCDTAFYRSQRYHESWDTPEALNDHDYEVFARVVLGLRGMLKEMASEK